MKKKIYIAGAAVIALALITLAGVFMINSGKKESRRSTVLEISGTCTVERGGKVIDATAGMQLFSEDTLVVAKGSSTRIRIDEDKFIYLDENSRLDLLMTGTAEESRTTAFLECGSMLTEVKRKLSAGSSYAVVTPNTSMDIHGTKTLTEVYEDVLGAIKTSAAVVEGQVSFKTIQKDSTGKPVSVSTELSVGLGVGITTPEENLLPMEDIFHIAEDGKTTDGKAIAEVKPEEIEAELAAPAFSEDFLTNVVAVLARSREEDVEDGFVAESVTQEELNAAISVLKDVIDGKILLPASVEEYIISQTQPYYDEPVVADGPEPVASDITEDDNFAGTGGSDTPVSNEDAEDAGAGDNADNGDDADADDNGDDAETGNADGSDGEEQPEKAEEEPAEKEKREKKETEDKEIEDKEIEEKESSEKEKKEDKETTEQEDKTAQENTEENTGGNTGNTSGGTSGGGTSGSGSYGGGGYVYSVTFKEPSNRTFTVPDEDDFTISGDIDLSLVFKKADGSDPDLYYTAGTLSGVRPGEVLPGYSGSEYEAFVVSEALVDTEGKYLYYALSSYVAFTGWYTSEASARNGVEADRVYTMPSSGNFELWPGITEIYVVVIENKYEKAADFVVPVYPSGNVVRYEDLSEERESSHTDIISMLVKKGTVISLPAIRDTDAQSDYTYLRKSEEAGRSTEFFCYTVAPMDSNVFFNPSLVYLDNTRPDTYGNDNDISVYYTANGAQNIVVDRSLIISAYFASDVEVRVLDNTEGTILVNEYGCDEYAMTLESYYNAIVSSGENFAFLPNDRPDLTDVRNAWKVTKAEPENGTALYTFKTGYFGTQMYIPKFSYRRAERPGGEIYFDIGSYQRELLCNYRLGNEGPIYGYDGNYPVEFGGAYTGQTSFPFDGAVIEGKYLFTVQAVDWVYISRGPSNTVSGTVISFVVESNNPYVIRSSASDNRYKFAVDPVNLFAESDSLPSACFIYAPADIEPGEADPNDVYRDEIQSVSDGSYSFIGARGYRLSGYSFELDMCTDNNAEEITLWIRDAIPVQIGGTGRKGAYILSFGDMISYEDYYDWDYLLSQPLELIPVFELAE